MRYSIAVLVSLACVACSTLLLQGAVKGELVRVRTDDGIPLHGAIWTPETGRARIGIALATGTEEASSTRPPSGRNNSQRPVSW